MLSASLMADLLFFDGEAEAQAFCVATEISQARLVFDQMCKIVKRNHKLEESTAKILTDGSGFRLLQLLDCHPWFGGFARPLGSSQPKSGLDPHIVVIDELHEWREHHRELLATLESGSGARTQPLIVWITTAGNSESYLWLNRDEFACRVLESNLPGNVSPIGDQHFAFIARADCEEPCHCGADPQCEWCHGTGQRTGDDCLGGGADVWAKANPELGVNPTLRYLEERAEKASLSVDQELDFLRYHCNVRIRSTAKIINPAQWALCVGEISNWSGNVYGGIDLGTHSDLASLAMVRKVGDKWECRHHSFAAEDGQVQLDRDPWATFVQHGCLTVLPGSHLEISEVMARAVEYTYQYGAIWTADPNNAKQMLQTLKSEHGIPTTFFPQTYAHYNEPTRELIRLIARCEIVHDGDPLLAWALGNLVIHSNSRGEFLPDKLKSMQKIDPATALIMALGAAISTEYGEGQRRDDGIY